MSLLLIYIIPYQKYNNNLSTLIVKIDSYKYVILIFIYRSIFLPDYLPKNYLQKFVCIYKKSYLNTK